MKKFFFVSISLHGLILISLFALQRHFSEVEFRNQKSILQIEILNKFTKQPLNIKDTPSYKNKKFSNPGIGDPKARSPKTLAPPTPSLHPKYFGTQNTVGSLLMPSGQAKEQGYTLHDNPTSAWGSGGNDFERVQDYNLMKKIFDDVDAKLFYPSILASHQIQGVVNSRLVFNQNGDCDFTATQINSTERHLRVYILSVLKKVCNQNYAHYIGERTLTNVDMSFLFRLTETNDKDFLAKQEFVIGNVLNFQRNSHQSVAQWNVGPFTGVFPIPAVNLDFEWLAENWSKYIEGKDPMDEFRH